MIFIDHWNYAPHALPNICTSPPYHHPLRQPVFCWLLRDKLSMGGCLRLSLSLRPRVFKFSFLFCHSNRCPNRCDKANPHAPPLSCLLFNSSFSIATNCWLIVVFHLQTTATKGHTPANLSIFDAFYVHAKEREDNTQQEQAWHRKHDKDPYWVAAQWFMGVVVDVGSAIEGKVVGGGCWWCFILVLLCVVCLNKTIHSKAFATQSASLFPTHG